jgi:hypothetical protein
MKPFATARAALLTLTLLSVAPRPAEAQFVVSYDTKVDKEWLLNSALSIVEAKIRGDNWLDIMWDQAREQKRRGDLTIRIREATDRKHTGDLGTPGGDPGDRRSGAAQCRSDSTTTKVCLPSDSTGATFETPVADATRPWTDKTLGSEADAASRAGGLGYGTSDQNPFLNDGGIASRAAKQTDSEMLSISASAIPNAALATQSTFLMLRADSVTTALDSLLRSELLGANEVSDTRTGQILTILMATEARSLAAVTKQTLYSLQARGRRTQDALTVLRVDNHRRRTEAVVQ